MAITPDVVLPDHTPTNHTFTEQIRGPGNVVRIDTGSTLSSKTLLDLKSTTNRQRGKLVDTDRHYSAVKKTIKDPETGMDLSIVVAMTIIADQHALVTEAEVQHLVAMNKAFHSDANLTRRLRSEM